MIGLTTTRNRGQRAQIGCCGTDWIRLVPDKLSVRREIWNFIKKNGEFIDCMNGCWFLNMYSTLRVSCFPLTVTLLCSLVEDYLPSSLGL